MAVQTEMAAAPQPHQPQYTTVVLVQQQPSNNDYTIQQARVGGAVLVPIAVANLVIYFFIGIQYGEWIHSTLISSFVIFFVLGILTLVAATRSNLGVVYGVHVWCCITYVQSLVQIGLSLWDLFSKGLFMLQYLMSADTLILDSIVSSLALAAFICAIVIQCAAGRVTFCRPAANVKPQQGHIMATQGNATPVYGQPGMAMQGYPQPGYAQQYPGNTS